MKIKRPPGYALAPAHDPLLDESPGRQLWSAICRWALAIAGALGLLVAGGILDRLDHLATIDAAAAQNREMRRELARLNHQLATRRAAGDCTTLFYLVEADSAERAGEKLSNVAMQLAESSHDLLYRERLPMLRVPQ